MTLFVKRPSPAFVVACIALLVALGGTSYAAFSLPKNSVGTKQIKNGAVTGPKINLSTVGTVHSADTANSAAFANNANNAASLGGAPSSSYLRRTVTEVAFSNVASGTFNNADAMCPAGYEAVGGGVFPGNVLDMTVTGSGPLLSDVAAARGEFDFGSPGKHAYADGWRVFAVNNGGTTQQLAVAAICAQIGP
jgi:hypothetical protein